MASVLRLVFAATILGQLACSSSDDGDGPDGTQPAAYMGTLGNQPAMQTPPAGPATTSPPPSAAGGAQGGSMEGQPNPVLVTPPVENQTPAASGGAGGAQAIGAAGAMNAGGQGGAPAQPPVVTSPQSDLPLPPGNGGVARPAGTPGNLRVLPWAGFRAAMSYTFDDTNGSQIQHYQELNALGVPFTFYLITGANHTQDLQSAVWPQALRDGHEIGNHTESHFNTGEGNLTASTDNGDATLERMFGITVYTMAAPYGAADYVNIARTRYLINRGTPGGTISPTGMTDPFNIPTLTPGPASQAGPINAQVDSALNGGSWGTVLVHGFLNSVNDGAYNAIDLSVFQQTVNYAKGKGNVWIDTVVAVGAYWRGQTAFAQAAAAPTTNGDSRTVAWTLPDHFPPGKFLRVTVDGGTLTQNGAPLAWNDHGFYEVALDARSVTLSP